MGWAFVSMNFSAAIGQEEDARDAEINRVLQLDGGRDYVELPSNLFTIEVVTVEGWIQYRTLEMDGFEFTGALRPREDGRDIPVVVITAQQLSDDDRRRLIA